MMRAYGNVLVDTAATAIEVACAVEALDLKPPVLIKPNWGTVECFTEAKVLDWVLASVPKPAVVIESMGWARAKFILTGEKPGKRTRLGYRQDERWFLEYAGIDQVLAKYGVEYINLTEEVWANRTAEPASVQAAVESRFSPIHLPDLYEKVPSRLFDLRGGSLLSLAKYRLLMQPFIVSFSIKNLFGLIPGPGRGRYHGRANADLDESVLDINKIYRSLFNMAGIVEAIFSAGNTTDEFQQQEIARDKGLLLASRDPQDLDAFAAATAGVDPNNVSYLRLAASTFGSWHPDICDQARASGIKIFLLSALWVSMRCGAPHAHP